MNHYSYAIQWFELLDYIYNTVSEKTTFYTKY